MGGYYSRLIKRAAKCHQSLGAANQIRIVDHITLCQMALYRNTTGKNRRCRDCHN